MASAISEALLDEKLTALEQVRPWSPRVVSKLEALLRSERDADVYRVNPLKFAAEKGITGAEATDLFLHAAKLGLFQMNWHVLCPQCSDTVSSFTTLRTLNAHFFCDLCSLDAVAHLDDYIQVAFTVAPAVRDIAFNHPETLSVEEYFFPYRFAPGGRIPNGPYFLDAVKTLTKVQAFVSPGERKAFALDLGAGFARAQDLVHNAGFLLSLRGERRAAPQTVKAEFVDGKFVVDEAHLWPGPVTIEVENRSPARLAFMVIHKTPEMAAEPAHPLVFDPFVSGKAIFTNQTFRDLFQLETIKGAEGIGIRDITLLFTDLKGSTAMYDRIGDLKAFALVQQHFHRLGRVVRSHDGAIVKTIGDAIMASFQSPEGAVKAALEMLAEIEAFNQEHGDREIILKIGVHKGASIAVTLNDRLDFFGQTVNIASRVQGLADAEEIYITDDVMRAPGVKDLLVAPFRVEPKTAQLKGIEAAMRVFRIAEHPAAAPVNGAAKGNGAAHPPVKHAKARATKKAAHKHAGRKPARAGRR